MKKIILSVAVAAMALTTTASALEDIKVNGQAKLWYETSDAAAGDLFTQGQSSGEVVFKLGMTGKQGDVGFGATVYQTSTMGLETSLVANARTNTSNIGTATSANGYTNTNTQAGQMYTGEAYVTAPAGSSTTLKIGKQELNTPLAFTEKWNATPNTFNAAVAVNKSIDNLTIIGAYVGQDNATNFKADGEVSNAFTGTGATIALAGLYKTDSLAVNAWYYGLEGTATALWLDAGVKVAGMNVKGYFSTITPHDSTGLDATTAIAASVATKVGGVSLSGAFSTIGDDNGLAFANVSTGFKKTKLPTAAIYLDGLAVAQPGATSMKVKAVTKISDTKIIAQLVSCANDNGVLAGGTSGSEIDLIAVTKLGDFNVKGIIMQRSFEVADSQMHVRAIVSLNF